MRFELVVWYCMLLVSGIVGGSGLVLFLFVGVLRVWALLRYIPCLGVYC